MDSAATKTWRRIGETGLVACFLNQCCRNHSANKEQLLVNCIARRCRPRIQEEASLCRLELRVHYTGGLTYT